MFLNSPFTLFLPFSLKKERNIKKYDHLSLRKETLSEHDKLIGGSQQFPIQLFDERRDILAIIKSQANSNSILLNQPFIYFLFNLTST
jgi:hypothetical protein